MNDYNDLQETIKTLHGRHLALLTSVEQPEDMVRHQSKVELLEVLLQAIDGAEINIGGELNESYRTLSDAKQQADSTLIQMDEPLDTGVGVQ